jgi:hypothetical protein
MDGKPTRSVACLHFHPEARFARQYGASLLIYVS